MTIDGNAIHDLSNKYSQLPDEQRQESTSKDTPTSTHINNDNKRNDDFQTQQHGSDVLDIPLKDNSFSFGTKLGSGVEGSVFLATAKDGSNRQFAIKVLSFIDKEVCLELQKDIEQLFHLEHPHIVKHWGSYTESHVHGTQEEFRVHLVMAYVKGITLERMIKSYQKGNLTLHSSDIKKWTRELSEALRYLHERSISHCDIKADNVIISSTSESVCLCDFGFLKKLDVELGESVAGTLHYMAPEVYHNKRYDESVDIWSLGIVLLQMILLKQQSQLPDVRGELQEDHHYFRELLHGYDAQLTEVVVACCEYDPTDRPTPKEIISFLDGEIPTLKRAKRRQVPSLMLRTQSMFSQNTTELMSPRYELSSAQSSTPPTPLSSRTQSFRSPFSKKSKNQSFHNSSSNSLKSDSTSEGDDALSCLTGNKKARMFWKKNGWERDMNVPWNQFREAYLKYMNWKRLTKPQERGIKQILCENDEEQGEDYVSVVALNEAVKTASFPFNTRALTSLKYHTEDEHTIEDLRKQPSPQEFNDAKKEYLNMIIEHETIFVDPISQESLSVEQHVAPLSLVSDTESDDMLKNTYDMDKEFDNSIRNHRRSGSRSSTDFTDNESPRPETRQEERTLDAVDYLSNIRNGHRFIILGPAATGKSCLMRMVLHKFALSAANGDNDALVPILVPVTQLSFIPNSFPFDLRCIRASAYALWQGLKYNKSIERFLIEMFRRRQVLLLLDGLDEADEANRGYVQDSILSMDESPNLGIILTSRVTGFEYFAESDIESQFLFRRFSIARIRPLSLDVQLQIARRRGVNDKSFEEALQGKYSELAKTPLMLSLMIEEFKVNKRLPVVRAMLYEQAINTMVRVYLTKYRRVEHAEELETEVQTLISFLQYIALKLHQEQRRDFTEDDLDEYKDGLWSMMQQHIDNGYLSLVMRISDAYRFSHLSFQEYLVAAHWADRSSPSMIRDKRRLLFGSTFSTRKVKPILKDPWYRETLMLCAGKMELDDFIEFANFLLDKFAKSRTIFVDTIVGGMLQERSEDEAEGLKPLEARLKKEASLQPCLAGLTHPSKELREMALAQLKALWYNDEGVLLSIVDEMIQQNRRGNLEIADFIAHVLIEITQRCREPTPILNKLLGNLYSGTAVHLSARILGRIAPVNNKDIIDKLLLDLEDGDTDLAKVAINSLSQIMSNPSPQHMDSLLMMLRSDNIRLSNRAADVLGNVVSHGDNRVISALMPRATERPAFAIALAKIADKNDDFVIDTVLDGIATMPEDLVPELFRQFAGVDNRKMISKLLKILQETRNRRARSRAVLALQETVPRGDFSTVRGLLMLLDDSTAAQPAIAALKTLAGKGDRQVLHALRGKLKMYRKSKPSRAAEICEALGMISTKGDADVRGALLTCLHETYEDLVSAAAEALRKVANEGDNEAIRSLQKQLSNPSNLVCECAAESLGHIAQRGNSGVVNDMLSIVNNEHNSLITFVPLRTIAIETLGQVAPQGDPKVIDIIRSYLDDSQHYVVIAAAKSLGQLAEHGDHGVIEALVRRMGGDEEVQEACIEALLDIITADQLVHYMSKKSYKSLRPYLFSLFIRFIRAQREKRAEWRLKDEHHRALHSLKTLESDYIIRENQK